MWKEKSPGVKILWIWTIGTAAILVANVATTRMRDMQKQMDTPQSTIPQQESPHVIVDDSTGFVRTQDKFES
ncbi:hypothetical protein AgCh_022465 [Apium graveolens]